MCHVSCQIVGGVTKASLTAKQVQSKARTRQQIRREQSGVAWGRLGAGRSDVMTIHSILLITSCSKVNSMITAERAKLSKLLYFASQSMEQRVCGASDVGVTDAK